METALLTFAMGASFHKITFDSETLFHCDYNDLPSFDHPWHFHPELELTLILESQGIRYIGDNISRFKEGDLVLLGSNLPHLWQNTKEHFEKEDGRSRSITLQIPPDFIGTPFKNAPELQPLVQLFKMAERGIHFPDQLGQQLMPLLMNLNNRSGLRKWVGVFDILSQLTEATAFELLASPGYLKQGATKDFDVMNKIFEHIGNNVHNKITLQEMADMACLTKPSFCRFFKQRTGKPFFVFLNEYRIKNAKRMLLENKGQSIGTIATQSGFPSVQHFNAKFKELNNGLTPTNYVKQLKGV
ncbi:helix-turn-helix domain-containing protein [Maribacter sp. 2307ULW6-5]|uniref:helix-turn-helix domain-containing protein n=1 Tax=Maribacter sp. 2307ULW6-5 TaxID=3386275 RepID=UPI0039BCE5A7